ncbi:hypothetical protein D3C76_204190 [compost metagenome]
MKATTYSLHGNAPGTEQFYRAASLMADELIEITNGEKALHEFDQFVLKKSYEAMEALVYVLEFVMIGILLKKYGGKGTLLHEHGGKVLARLFALKRKGKSSRAVIGRLKGIVNTTLLVHEGKVVSRAADLAGIKQFYRLLGWLESTDEFEQETKRLQIWGEFFSGKSLDDSTRELLRAMELADWFEQRSLEILGAYTTNVDSFIDNKHSGLRWKENQIFCTRSRVEYHLNMVGAELMNRAFRSDFLNTEEKRVLLPICMREKGEGSCRAVQTEHGYLCKGCMKDCQVNSIAALGRQHDFQVYMVPHASTAFGQRKEADSGNIGIVGIACPLNLISGGYKARELGYEPQCVLLNYSGCSRHWHDTGIVTNIELDRLKSLLEIT